MTAKANFETEAADSITNENIKKQAFRCPHCDKTYDDERQTRVHITRADDTAHRHRNGLMPEEKIEVVNADGEVIKTRSRRPDEIDLTDVTTDDFPNDLSEKRTHALVVATHHPNTDNRRELTEMVRERLEDSRWEVSPPSVPTVCRAIDEFYHPQKSEDASDGLNSEALADLTPTQQSIIIGKILYPDEPDTGIADRIGCACTYPGRVANEKGHVLTKIRTRLDEDDTIESVLADELPAEQLATLIENDLLSNISLDVHSIVAEMNVDETSSTGRLTTIIEETKSENSSNSEWGSPVDHTTGLCAVPDDPFGSTDDNDTGYNSLTEQPPDTDPAPAEDIDSGEAHSKDATPSAVVIEITALKQRVAFFRRVLGPVSQTDEQMALLESFATQVEQSCEAMLEASDHQ